MPKKVHAQKSADPAGEAKGKQNFFRNAAAIVLGLKFIVTVEEKSDDIEGNEDGLHGCEL